MRNMISRITILQILGAGALTIALGYTGRKLATRARKSRARLYLDEKLDLALADSMDCSDATTSY